VEGGFEHGSSRPRVSKLLEDVSVSMSRKYALDARIVAVHVFQSEATRSEDVERPSFRNASAAARGRDLQALLGSMGRPVKWRSPQWCCHPSLYRF